MPPRVRTRKVDKFPPVACFVPISPESSRADPVVLKIEEWEAMRLKDMEDLNQEECAVRMEVSRQTFQNILDSARKKMVQALVEGLPIRIEGGDYATSRCLFSCRSCGEEYEVRYARDRHICPKCGSEHVLCKKKAEVCKNWCEAGLQK